MAVTRTLPNPVLKVRRVQLNVYAWVVHGFRYKQRQAEAQGDRNLKFV